MSALEDLQIKCDYSLFMSAPLFVPLVKKLTPNVFVLDAQDNLLKHAMYRDVRGLEENYQYCLNHADLIYTNSKETAEWFLVTRPDVVHIPNGVDSTMFDGLKSFPLPKDLKGISSPVVGYAGKMQQMFDVDLVEKAVLDMPDVNFVFIGQKLDSKWTEKLWKYPNVYYLGDKYYDLLPQYLFHFDVCIIPYNKETHHNVDPIKLYEYLAMGKPVVATKVGGSTTFSDFPQVRIAESSEDFIRGLQFFIEKVKANLQIEAYPLPDFCLWKNKANRIIRDIIMKSDQ